MRGSRFVEEVEREANPRASSSVFAERNSSALCRVQPRAESQMRYLPSLTRGLRTPAQTFACSTARADDLDARVRGDTEGGGGPTHRHTRGRPEARSEPCGAVSGRLWGFEKGGGPSISMAPVLTAAARIRSLSTTPAGWPLVIGSPASRWNALCQ